MTLPLSRRCLTEAIGTFLLILFGCGAMVVDHQTGSLTHPGVAAAWGGIVAVLIYAIGDLSGAHLNPAVSIGFVLSGRFGPRDAAAYVAAQCVGAIAAAYALAAVLGVDESALGATRFEIAAGPAWAIEWMMTATLMFVILGVSTGAKEKSITAGLAVGMTIALEALIAGPLTKASMNPARSLGPAIAAGQWDQLWLYVTAPLAGAVGGVIVYRWIDATRFETAGEAKDAEVANADSNDVD